MLLLVCRSALMGVHRVCFIEFIISSLVILLYLHSCALKALRQRRFRRGYATVRLLLCCALIDIDSELENDDDDDKNHNI